MLLSDQPRSNRHYKESNMQIAMQILQKRPFNAASDEIIDGEDLFKLFTFKRDEPQPKSGTQNRQLILALITGYWSDEQIICEAPRYFKNYFIMLQYFHWNWRQQICLLALRFARVIANQSFKMPNLFLRNQSFSDFTDEEEQKIATAKDGSNGSGQLL